MSNPHIKQKGLQRRSAEAVQVRILALTTDGVNPEILKDKVGDGSERRASFVTN